MTRIAWAAAIVGVIILGGLYLRVGQAGLASFGAGGRGGVFPSLPGSDSEFDVLNYGAKADNGVTDNSAPFNSAINAACSAMSGGTFPSALVYVPASVSGSNQSTFYDFVTPPVWGCEGLRIQGAGREATRLRLKTSGGWFTIQASTVTPFPTTTALISGSGAAASFTHSTSDQFLELRDLPQGDINGQAAITVEAFVNLASPTTSAVIVASGGKHLSTDAATGAINFNINGAGKLSCTLTTGGVSTTVTEGTALSTATLLWVACSYDGTTIRLYDAVPGTASTAPVASSAATGTITQNPWESFTFGQLVSKAIDFQTNTGSVNGAVDGFRLSITARYTGTITAPSANLQTCDSNCAVEWTGNLGGNNSALVQVSVQGNPRLLTPRGGAGQPFLHGVQLSDLDFESTTGTNGLLVRSCTACIFDNIRAHARNGVVIFNNAFAEIWKSLDVSGSGWFSLAFDSGTLEFDQPQIAMGQLGLVLEGGGAVINVAQMTEESNTAIPILADSAGGVEQVQFNNATLDMEADSPLLATVTDWAHASLTFNSSEIDGKSDQAVPVFILDTVPENGLALYSTRTAGVASGQFAFVTNGTAPAGPITLSNYKETGGSGVIADSSARYVRWLTCSGLVTLSSGSGTFTDACVSTASICQAADLTTPANAVTLAAPSAGSIAMTGTGTDVAKVLCQ